MNLHDHFDGSANCVECKGPCKLKGQELLSTELLRMLFERYALSGWRELPQYEESILAKHEIDCVKLWRRAQEATTYLANEIEKLKERSGDDWRKAAALVAACEAAEGVLTEPGIMDVDEWKAWSRRTVEQIRAALTAHQPQTNSAPDSSKEN